MLIVINTDEMNQTFAAGIKQIVRKKIQQIIFEEVNIDIENIIVRFSWYQYMDNRVTCEINDWNEKISEKVIATIKFYLSEFSSKNIVEVTQK